jgi:hypothetical protein
MAGKTVLQDLAEALASGKATSEENRLIASEKKEVNPQCHNNVQNNSNDSLVIEEREEDSAVQVEETKAGKHEEIDGADEKNTESVLDRIRARPAALAVPLAGILFAGWMVLSAAGKKEPKSAMKETPEKIVADFPEIEEPKLRDEPIRKEELERMMLEADEKARKRRKSEEAISLPEKTRAPAKEDIQASQVEKIIKKVQARGARASKAPNTKETPPEKTTQPIQLKDSETAPTAIKKTPRGEAFYRAGVTIKVAEVSKDTEKRSNAKFAPGTTFKARLMVGVSTELSSATVLAKAMEPVRGLDGEIAIPSGATLQGRMRGSADRIFFDFHTVLVGSERLTVNGYAVSGKLPGVPAVVREGGAPPSESRAGSVLARGALATANGAVGAALGGTTIAHELARNVAVEGMSEVGREVTATPERTLELPQGTVFSVVLTE